MRWFNKLNLSSEKSLCSWIKSLINPGVKMACHSGVHKDWGKENSGVILKLFIKIPGYWTEYWVRWYTLACFTDCLKEAWDFGVWASKVQQVTRRTKVKNKKIFWECMRPPDYKLSKWISFLRSKEKKVGLARTTLAFEFNFKFVFLAQCFNSSVFFINVE